MLRFLRASVERGIAADLRHRGGVRGDDGRAAGLSLNDGQAEAFVPRGQEQHPRAGDERGHIVFRHVAGHDDGITHLARTDLLLDAFDAETGRTDEQELDRIADAAPTLEDRECVDEVHDVLLLLEPARVDEERPRKAVLRQYGVLGCFGDVRVIARAIDRERRRHHALRRKLVALDDLAAREFGDR